MTRIDKAEEHKQLAGQTSRELAGLIAAIEAEFDGHIASDLPGHQNFRKSMIRRALAIVKTQLRQPESPEAALAEAMGYEDISALAKAVRARNLCSDQQQILPDRLFCYVRAKLEITNPGFLTLHEQDKADA